MLIYVYCVQYGFLMIKHWFCWEYQYNKYIFNLIDIYIFIPVSGCVGSTLLKTALFTLYLLFVYLNRSCNNYTLRNILYKDINGICPKFNEYDRAKKLQLILSSSQIMRFTVPFVKKSIALRKVGSTAA
jgi:hypothetical protein